MRQDVFGDQVRDALSRLHELAYLEIHPLARLALPGPSGREGERLRQLLLDAVEQIKPQANLHLSSPEWRRYQYLYQRYVEGLTHEQVVQKLGISRRQGHRDHHEAMGELTSLLWSRFQKRQVAPSDVKDAGSEQADVPTRTAEDLLEAELLKLGQVSEPVLTDLPKVLSPVLATVANLASARQVRLQIESENGLPLVAIPRDALRQVLLGVLSYVLDSCKGGEVELGVASERSEVKLTLTSLLVNRKSATLVQDDGPIIEDSRLLVSHRLLEMRGGSLTLSQEQRAQGPAFTLELRLPVVRPVVLLVIDDDPDFVLLIQRYLNGHPYRVLQANNAERALKLARESTPQIVILDVLMPSQDGWQILQELRRLEQTMAVPVVICSVLYDRTLAESLGATHYLSKPVTQRTLLALLDECRAAVQSQGRLANTDRTRSL